VLCGGHSIKFLKLLKQHTITKYSADDFARHFPAKIDTIRLLTSTATPPEAQPRSLPVYLTSLEPVTPKEMLSMIADSAVKSSCPERIKTGRHKLTAPHTIPS
jgi:hypothetical protein